MKNLFFSATLPGRGGLQHLTNNRIKILAITFACITFFTATAQQVDYDITAHYTNDNGLPQNSINAIQEDANGFIWMTTFGGLIRFDGNTLRTYNPGNTSAMHTNSFYTLSLNNKTLEITPAFYDGTLLTVTDSKTIINKKIAPTSHYAITNGNGLTDFGNDFPYYLRKMGWFSPQAVKEREALGGWVNLITQPNKPNGYLSMDDGKLWYYNGDIGNLCYVNSGSTFEYLLTGNNLFAYKEETGLIGWSNGQPLADITGTLPMLLKKMEFTQLLPVIFFSKNDDAFAKIGDNLYKIEWQSSNLNATLISTHITMPDITSIMYLPNENLLMIGTATTGLYILKNKPFKSLLFQYPKAFRGSYYQAENSLYALSNINDSTLLTTTGTIALNGTSKVFDLKEWHPRTLVRLSATNVLLSGNRGAYQTNESFENPTLLKNFPTGVINTFLRTADTLYLGMGSTLVKTTVAGQKFLNTQQQTFKGITISSLVKNEDGTIYLGTRNGLYLLHNNGQLDTMAGLQKTYITTLYKSTHNDIWIGTLSQGWYRLNKKGVVKMPMDTKGYLLRVHSFTEDSKGYMWMPTNNGLFRFLYSDLQKDDFSDPDKRLFYNFFDKSYGSATSEYNGSCVPTMAKVKNGGFVFPSIQGLVLMYPDKIPIEQPNRPLLLEDMVADTTSITEENLTLEPNFNTLTMHVTTPFYGDHYNLQLEYKLSDEASKWIKVSETGNIRFNRLPSGTYHLYIRKISGYGADNSQVVDFEFTVSPQWYRSLWFTILWICAGGLFSLLYIRHKGKTAAKRQLELEKEVKNRTMALNSTMGILEETIEQLTASKAKLKQTSEFREHVTSLVLHDIRSPLMFLDEITKTIYSSSDGVVPDAFREKLYDLHTGVKEIGGYAQRLLIWVNLQQEGFVMKKEMVNIQHLLQENGTHYQPLAQQKGIFINSFTSQDICFDTQRNLLEIVVRNLIDNAIKNTESGQIYLSASVNEGNLKISVADTGKGMSANTVQRLLKDDTITASGNTGLGYRFIHDVLKKMNGKLEIESEPDKGTTISIIFFNSSELLIVGKRIASSCKQ